MLVLSAKNQQKIILTDTVHGTEIIIKSFLRMPQGDWMLGFDAPKTIKITRERNDVRRKKD